MMPSIALVHPGASCLADLRKAGPSRGHIVEDPEQDVDFLKVFAWLTAPERDLATHMMLATDAAIKYVLDGARTKRLDLFDPSVDKDERSSVGTKLQYHVLEELGLEKVAPLDTVIEGIPVELKSTIRTNWQIPVEGQCQVTVLIQVDPKLGRVAAWLMRTHRVLLNNGKNQDKKRTISKTNMGNYAKQLLPWTSLPGEPLKRLAIQDADIIFGTSGMELRLAHLFSVLPDIVVPRTSIAIVGGTAGDVMKRARSVKSKIAEEIGNLTLVATWKPQSIALRELGFSPLGESWVSVSPDRLKACSSTPVLLGIDPASKRDQEFLQLVRALPHPIQSEWVKKFPDLR